jgi:division protein CdvB (Snf7/Vps24/ESCRT-III family)
MVLRLHTVTKLGSILVTVTPVIGVIKETRSRLVGIVPNVASNLNEANSILSRCLANMGTSTPTVNAQPVVCGEEALKVLEEANLAAEKTIRERFPQIPDTLEEKAAKETQMLTG